MELEVKSPVAQRSRALSFWIPKMTSPRTE
jgi:hypothetical protein